AIEGGCPPIWGPPAVPPTAGPPIWPPRRRPPPATGPAQVALGHLMSASSPFPSGHDRAAAVTRLRAAGCVFAEDEARLLVSAAQTPAGLAPLVGPRAGAARAGSRARVGPAARRPAARTRPRLGGFLRPAGSRGPRRLHPAPPDRVP